MDLILKKAIPVICIALAAPLVLSSCSRTVSSSETTSPVSSAVQEQVSPAESEDLPESAAPSDESWKVDFEKKPLGKLQRHPGILRRSGGWHLSGLRQN